MQALKQYTVTIKGRVLELGFRGYLRDLCWRQGIKSIVYNTDEGNLKLLCEANKEKVEELTSLIKDYKLAEITDIRIEEGIELPSRPFRAVLGVEEEIYDRLDEGVRLLRNMNSKLDKLDEIGATLKEISGKL